jgi:hypothetical protein
VRPARTEGRFRRLRFPLVLAAVITVLAVVPLWPWRPACRCDTIWRGDLRDVYVDEFVEGLTQANVAYRRFGDLVLLRAIPWLDGDEWWSQADAVYNTECKSAEALSDDQTIGGVLYPAPEIVKRLKAELEPEIGPDTRFNPDGSRAWYGSDKRVRYSCSLFRASILEPSSSANR